MIEQGPRLGIEAEARVYGAERIHQRRLNSRLLGKLPLDACRTLIEHFPRGDAVAARLARIRDFEQINQERRRLLRGLGFRLRARRLFLRDATLYERING